MTNRIGPFDALGYVKSISYSIGAAEFYCAEFQSQSVGIDVAANCTVVPGVENRYIVNIDTFPPETPFDPETFQYDFTGIPEAPTSDIDYMLGVFKENSSGIEFSTGSKSFYDATNGCIVGPFGGIDRIWSIENPNAAPYGSHMQVARYSAGNYFRCGMVFYNVSTPPFGLDATTATADATKIS